MITLSSTDPQLLVPKLSEMQPSVKLRSISRMIKIAALCCATAFGQQQRFASHEEALHHAKDVVGRMTLEEKIAQVHGVQTHKLYRVISGNDRLGIPSLRVTNGPAGVGPGGAGSQKRATALPAPLALAASWDPELSFDYGVLVGTETRALGFNLLESPDVNIARIPQGGRVFEGYGEDPYLTSQMAVANIKGIQSTGTIANVKHYLANNQETNRGTINEIVNERTLHEIYLPAFEASVKDAHVASVMCAYPRLNGEFNCESGSTLDGILRRLWGFDGFTTSDFGAVHSTVPSALAGLDVELPTEIYYGDRLKEAILSGQLSPEKLDDMLVHRFAKMMELGWWNPSPLTRPIPTLEDGAFARKVATQSMVLLKNKDAILPLNREEIKHLALIGPYAVRQMTGGGGSSHVIPLYSVAPVDGIDAALLQQTPITLLDGTDVDTAASAARKADVAIVMVGDDEGEDHDHVISLPAAQDLLIEAVAAANPHTVVVIKSGSAVLMPWITKVPAVLEAWYPGEEDGNAVADVLFGDVNPSGKLPITFPANVEQTLAHNPEQYPGNGTTVLYSEGLEVGYRAYQAHDQKPLFPFGFGLSYTSFSYENFAIRSAPSGGAVASLTLTNTGKREGAETAQLYLTFPEIPEGNEPPKQLKAFRKVTLKPGESRLIELKLDSRSFSYWSSKMHSWQRARGTFALFAGGSSVDTPLHSTFRLP